MTIKRPVLRSLLRRDSDHRVTGVTQPEQSAASIMDALNGTWADGLSAPSRAFATDRRVR